jgi:tape measure domain-containing protein
LKLQVQFDRRSVQNELNALGRNISQRTYRLEVATNLAAEIKNAGTLAKALRGLDNAVQKNKGIANRAAAGQGAGTVDASSFSTMLGRATKPALEALYQGMAKAKIPMADVGRGTVNELRASIISGVPAITRDIAQGLANGLDPKLKENGREGAKSFIDAFKSATGIASPSKIFKQLGEFSADGLEIGFLDGLKEFKSKSVDEIRKIVALLKFELAKVSDLSGMGGPSVGSLRQRLVGQRAYTSPIGPLPHGSKAPWAAGQSGYEPRMVSRPYGQAYPAVPGSFLAFSRQAGQVQPSGRTPGSFLGFSQRATQISQASAIGGPLPPPPPRPPSGGGGMGGMRGMGGFGSALGGINLPGTGTIRELGQEFSFAAKQVLLFGTAYKALAFITDFPAQVSNAVGQLQTFNNTLAAISPTAKEAAASNQLILNLVDRYNIPLQSARDGFTKLYASMQPAGFGGEEIRGLFTGISKAAATFGMSADKVDRVNYAFAQMASKGQVMSEELKGQLGDVLPGAMAIFAEAAGFKGPKAIQEFSKELEAGRYKGVAMVDLLNNVSIVLNTKFSKGAEGAAKTFQGAINNMQTSLTLFYQAFEPAAVQFLNVFVNPISSQLKTLSDGFNAFFKGTAAKTSGGMAIARELESLKPSFEGILSNLKSLIPTVQAFGTALGMAAKFALSLAADPLLGYLARMYPIVYALTTAFGLLRAALISNIGQFLLFNTQLALGMSRLAAVRGTMALTGTTAAVTTGAIRGLNIALASLGSKTIIGVALVGLSMLIEKFIKAGVEAENAKQKMLSFADSVKTAGQAADVGGLETTLAAEKKLAVRLKDAQALLEKIKAGQGEVTAAQAQELQSLGLASNMTFARQRTSKGSNLQVQVGAPGAVQANIQAAQKGYGEAQTRILQTQNALNTALKQQTKQETELKRIRESEDEGKAKGKISLENLVSARFSQRAAVLKAEMQLAKEETAALAPGTVQSERMLEYYGEFRQTLIDMAIIQAQIEDAEGNRADYLKDGMTAQQLDYNLQELRNQLQIRGIELLTTEQKYRNKAAQDTEKIAGEQEKINSTLLNIRYENGYISTQEYNRLKIDEQIRKILQDLPTLSKQQKDEVAGIIRNKQKQLAIVKEEIELLRAANNTERRRIELRREGYSEKKIQEIIDLEKVRDNIKATREIIDNFVDDTSRDYKGFLKAVISGEDAVDALEQFQAGLKDRVLTIFLDFTMKPVEDFFKDVVSGKLIESLFKKDLEKLDKEKPTEATSTNPVQATNDNTKATTTNTTAIENLTNALNNQATGAGAGTAATGFNTFDTNILSPGLQATMQGMDTGVGFGAGLSGFSEQIGSISTGLQNATPSLTGFSEAVNGFSATSVDAAVKTAQAAGDASKNGSTLLQSLGGVVQGVGMLAGAAMGIVAGIKQIEKGDTSSVLGGIGSILMGVGGGILGFGKLFGANGGIASGGWKPFPVRAFANGGMVQGPTLGLVGEGKYNEAIVPLPDGRSIPVQMQGDSIRDKMGGSSNGGGMASPVLSMNFETTTINNVEYVSRDQLEQAMMETRKLAVRDGARQGANLAIDKLQQSPSTRRRIGI